MRPFALTSDTIADIRNQFAAFTGTNFEIDVQCYEVTNSLLPDWGKFQEFIADVVANNMLDRLETIYDAVAAIPGAMEYSPDSKQEVNDIASKYWVCDIQIFASLLSSIPDRFVPHYMVYGMRLIGTAKDAFNDLIFKSDEPLERLKKLIDGKRASNN